SFLEMAAFAALLIAAIRLRRRTDWHQRLMLCAMIALIGPAFGRILPMPLLGPFGGVAVMTSQLLFVAVAVFHDLRTRGRVHGAYGWGGATIIVEGLGVPLFAATPAIAALVAMIGPA
ncbi:MAG: hypothetical protein PSY12_11720, partial [bacterium]|nr:hypothetical protein [bacterium]